MQGFAQQVFALRPELVNKYATVGELAWVWGKDHAALGDTWRRHLVYDGGELAGWGWAFLPHRVARSDGGVVEVAHAYLGWQVHPDRGELLEEILSWFDELAPEVPHRTSVRAADQEALGRLAARGYLVDAANEYWVQSNWRDLVSVDEPVLPQGFRFLSAAEAGADAAVRAHVDAWHPSTFNALGFAGARQTWPYRGDLHVLVQAPDGTMASTAIMWLDEANRTAEFEPVGTHAGYRRRGLGQALLRHGMRRAGEAGATRMIVACLGAPAHTAARGLYYSVGFETFTREMPHLKLA